MQVASGAFRESQEEPGCTNHDRFARAIAEAAPHGVVIAEGFQLLHSPRVVRLLDHIFCVEIDRHEAKRRRTAPRSERNGNPLSPTDFDELLWPAHERYLATSVTPLRDRIVTLPAPASEAMVHQNVGRILGRIEACHQ